MKHISGQSKAKIQEVTLSMVTFSQKETTTKNTSKPLQRLGLRPNSQNYQKTKKVTIW